MTLTGRSGPAGCASLGGVEAGPYSAEPQLGSGAALARESGAARGGRVVRVLAGGDVAGEDGEVGAGGERLEDRV